MLVDIEKLISEFMVLDWTNENRIENLQGIKNEINKQLEWINTEGRKIIEDDIEEGENEIYREDLINKEEFMIQFKNFIETQLSKWQN